MSTSLLNLRSSQFPFDSYSDFVRTQHNDILSGSDVNPENAYWLYNAFEPYAALPFEQLGVSILEAVDGHINLGWSSSFEMQGKEVTSLTSAPSTLTNIAAELLRRIDNCGAAIEFRAIIVHCFPRELHHGSRSNDRLPQDPAWGDLLDVVGARFELKPNLFIGHLSRSMPKHTAKWHSLPSERDYVRLTNPGGGHITFTLCSASVSSVRTAIVLDSSFSPRAFGLLLSPSYLKMTLHRLCCYVNASDPHIFLSSYVEQILRDTLSLNRLSHTCTDMMCKAKTRTWHEIRLRADSLQEIWEELSRYFARIDSYGAMPQGAESLLSDLKIVADTTKTLEKSVRTQAQVETSYWSMQEAEESYKQAASVQRLTVVASIYLPLSFSASFLGMNVSQLNDSGPNIGFFFLLLLASIILPALIAVFFTDWWRSTALKWRHWLEPDHDCHPRQPLFIGSLLFMTVRAGYRWLSGQASSFANFRRRFIAKRRTVSVAGMRNTSADTQLEMADIESPRASQVRRS